MKMSKNVTRVEKLTGKLQKNLGIFNAMITNIKKLNEEIEIEIANVDNEIEVKKQEKAEMESIKAQNDKIKTNFEALLV